MICGDNISKGTTLKVFRSKGVLTVTVSIWVDSYVNMLWYNSKLWSNSQDRAKEDEH